MSDEKNADTAPADGQKEKVHGFDKAVSKLQQKVAELTKRLEEQPKQDHAAFETMLERVLTKVTPAKPSKVDELRASIESRLAADDSDPLATKAAIKDMLALVDSRHVGPDPSIGETAQRIARLEQMLEAQEQERTLISQRDKFQKSHPNLEFDAALGQLSDRIASEYSEDDWRAIPKSVRNRLSERMLDDIAVELAKPESKPDEKTEKKSEADDFLSTRTGGKLPPLQSLAELRAELIAKIGKQSSD